MGNLQILRKDKIKERFVKIVTILEFLSCYKWDTTIVRYSLGFVDVLMLIVFLTSYLVS